MNRRSLFKFISGLVAAKPALDAAEIHDGTVPAGPSPFRVTEGYIDDYRIHQPVPEFCTLTIYGDEFPRFGMFTLGPWDILTVTRTERGLFYRLVSYRAPMPLL